MSWNGVNNMPDTNMMANPNMANNNTAHATQKQAIQRQNVQAPRHAQTQPPPQAIVPAPPPEALYFKWNTLKKVERRASNGHLYVDNQPMRSVVKRPNGFNIDTVIDALCEVVSELIDQEEQKAVSLKRSIDAVRADSRSFVESKKEEVEEGPLQL